MSGATADPSPAFHASARRFDPAFKLFGSTIPVLSPADCKVKADGITKGEESLAVFPEDPCIRSCSQVVGDDAAESEPGSSSGSNDGCEEVKPINGIRKTVGTLPSAEFGPRVDDGDAQKSVDDVHGDTTQGKVRKKPGKPVPCPRCDSLDTKFCYYNNYNVNQPRHFCKNCQRYWTAGGTLRNVPVGAGRRRNKHSATHQGSAFPDGLVARDDEHDAAQQNLSCSESSYVGMNRQMNVLTSPSWLHARPSDGSSSSVILNFGQDSLLCESSDAVSRNVRRLEPLHVLGRFSGNVTARAERDSSLLGLLETENKVLYESQVQLQNGRRSIIDMSKEADATIELQPSGKSLGTSTVTAEPVETLSVESRMGSTTQAELPNKANASLGWAAGAPLAFVSGQWQHASKIGWGNINHTSMGTDLNPSSNIITANHIQAKAAVNHPSGSVALGNPWLGIPGQNPAWGSHVWGGDWTVPWAPAVTAATVASAANSVCGGPTLGKHPLEPEERVDDKGGCLWVPKSSRIDDPEESGRSSTWTALLVGNKLESPTPDSILRSFQPKAECTEADYPRVKTGHSNPAALTRSKAFQECILTSQDADA